MSIERELISKILLERDLSVVSEAGVTHHFFQSSEHREAYKFIRDHQREYAQVPSLEAFDRNFPGYKIAKAEDTLQYYADEMVADYGAILLEDGMIKATDLFEAGEIEEAANALAACLVQRNIQATKVDAVDITQNTVERLDRYREYAKSGDALKGISTGFHLLDLATGGMQPGQLFTFVGPAKAGKSTMLLLSAMLAHMGFYRPLFIGFEMSNHEQEERHDAIRAGISHNKLRNGKMKAEDYQRLERMARRLELMPPMPFVADPTSTSTLSGIGAQIDKFKPDVVYVDGVYMLDDENGEAKGSPQALTNITRGMKRLAQGKRLPIAQSTQVLGWKMDRKKGVTTNSIGYASSFAQDSDVLISVEPTEDEWINKVKILDGRNVRRKEIFVHWDWDNGEFTEMEEEETEEESDEEAATRF